MLMVVVLGLGPNEALCLLIDQNPQEIVGVASRELEVMSVRVNSSLNQLQSDLSDQIILCKIRAVPSLKQSVS